MSDQLKRDVRFVLRHPDGRPRLRMTVDSTGAPSLAFLDEIGRVTATFPQR